MIYLPVPHHCTKCGVIKPRTLEFYYWNKTRDRFEGQCIECVIDRTRRWAIEHPERVRERVLRWHAQNPEKVREHHRKYEGNHLEEKHKKQRQRYAENIEKFRERNRNKERLRRINNPEKFREYQRQKRSKNREKLCEQKNQRYARNPEKFREQERLRRINNPEKARESVHKYRARKHLLPATLTSEQWKAALNYWHGNCVYCGQPQGLFKNMRFHRDHFIPVTDPRPDNPGYVAGNMLPACCACNVSKGNRNPREWIIEHFGKWHGARILKRIERYFEWVAKQDNEQTALPNLTSTGLTLPRRTTARCVEGEHYAPQINSTSTGQEVQT